MAQLNALSLDDLTDGHGEGNVDRKSTRLNSSHSQISYAVFCLKIKTIVRHLDNALEHAVAYALRCIPARQIRASHHRRLRPMKLAKTIRATPPIFPFRGRTSRS